MQTIGGGVFHLPTAAEQYEVSRQPVKRISCVAEHSVVWILTPNKAIRRGTVSLRKAVSHGVEPMTAPNVLNFGCLTASRVILL